MLTLKQTLRDYDQNLIEIIANRWDVDIETDDETEAVEQLIPVMLNAEKAAHEWSRLDDQERGAMQMLLGSPQGRMPTVQFARLYGEIRSMGEEKRKRDKPHLNPVGVAEQLFYRGLIGTAFDQAKTGAQSFVYVPSDLATVLPIHDTGYDLSADADVEIAIPPPEPMFEELVSEEPPGLLRADTLIVDDLTTLLAYTQVHRVALKDGFVKAKDEKALTANFLGPVDRTRLFMLLRLALDLQLLQADNNHVITPERKTARKWLELSRTRQVSVLVQAWNETHVFNELWQVPTLRPEEAGWQNDPTLLRDMLRMMGEVLPPKAWIAMDDFILTIKETEPDFQRPGGDYDSWYIRDAESGEYLNGFESWNQIEGATLFYTLINPMRWLGLVDIGLPQPDAPPQRAIAFRLTAFGRAWAGQEAWPDVAEPEAAITFDHDGTLWTARTVSRYDRFQLARFADWKTAGDPYGYELTASSLKRAAEDGIQAEHIDAFLKRATGGKELPPPIKKLLAVQEKAGAGGRSSVMLKKLVVIEVDTVEQLEWLWQNPAYRRFLGKRLGPTVVSVREDQVNSLVEALESQGIPVEQYA